MTQETNNTTPNTPENWKKEFDKQFNPNKIWVIPSDDNKKIINIIKQFISTEIALAESKAVKNYLSKRAKKMWAKISLKERSKILKARAVVRNNK